MTLRLRILSGSLGVLSISDFCLIQRSCRDQVANAIGENAWPRILGNSPAM